MGDYIRWDFIFLRCIFSFIVAIIYGIIYTKTKTAREIEKKYERIKIGKIQQALTDNNIYERTLQSYNYAWMMVKAVLPYLLMGLAIVSYIADYILDELIEPFLIGYTRIFINALVEGPLYTPS
ncbi:MAG: permease [Promethearchaeota archaeon]